MNNNLEVPVQQKEEVNQPEETHHNDISNTEQQDKATDDNLIQKTNTYNNILNKNSNSKQNKAKHNAANDSFEKLILTLKGKIQNNKAPYKLTKHNNTSIPNKTQHAPSLPLSSSIKIKQLLSIIVPLDQCSSSPKLASHQEHEATQQPQSIHKPHYNKFISNISNNSHQSKTKHRVTPRTSLIKPKRESFRKDIPNQIIPLISNSFCPKFVTAKDKRYKVFHTSRNPSNNEHTFHCQSKANTDINNYYHSERANNTRHYNKDSLSKELE